MQSASRSKGSQPMGSPKSKSQKAKGKERAVESGHVKRPPSQLKQGWALVPLVLNGNDNSEADRKRSRSPTKRHSLEDSAKAKSRKTSTVIAKRSVAIEIVSDSDDDEIQEISVASTSKLVVQRSSKAAVSVTKTKSEVVDLDSSAKELSIASSTRKPSQICETFDLGDEDDQEDYENMRQRDDYSVLPEENDILDEVDDDWGDTERVWQESRAGSLDGSMYAEEGFEEEAASMMERSGDSDEDILELMENEDEISSQKAARPTTSKLTALGTPSKGLLKPLSSLRRSVSPAAGTSNITSESRPNAFTALMQGNSLDKQWAEAAENEAQPWRKGYVRPAPFYKVLDGMTIAVDAFKYGKIPGVEAYFLSHAHSDHYTNLSSSWCNGPIYCSIGTANLIRYKLGVKDEWLHPLEFDRVYEIAGIKVTTLDANHCPGSSIFVFEGPHTSPSSPYHKSPKKWFRYLHCGDFRASPAHLHHPALKGKKVDICYLDTTYLNPRYCFPAQEQVVDACAELIKCRVEGDREALMRGSGGGAQLVRQGEMMKGWLSKAKKEEDEDEDSKCALALADVKPAKPAERLLVMVGTYSIGKERIVKGIARAINAKVYCDQRKKEIFACQDDPELMAMVTDDPLEAQIHVTWLGQIKVDLLSDYLDKYKPHFSSIVGLRPTGWTFKPEGNMALTLKNPSVISMLSRELQRSYNPSWMTPTKDSTRTVEAYGVPYSEHSSFAELTCFAVSLDCVRFIPTVNVGSKKSRQAMAVWFDKWAGERKRRKAAGEPSIVPHRTMQYW